MPFSTRPAAWRPTRSFGSLPLARGWRVAHRAAHLPSVGTGSAHVSGARRPASRCSPGGRGRPGACGPASSPSGGRCSRPGMLPSKPAMMERQGGRRRSRRSEAVRGGTADRRRGPTPLADRRRSAVAGRRPGRWPMLAAPSGGLDPGAARGRLDRRGPGHGRGALPPQDVVVALAVHGGGRRDAGASATGCGAATTGASCRTPPPVSPADPVYLASRALLGASLVAVIWRRRRQPDFDRRIDAAAVALIAALAAWELAIHPTLARPRPGHGDPAGVVRATASSTSPCWCCWPGWW